MTRPSGGGAIRQRRWWALVALVSLLTLLVLVVSLLVQSSGMLAAGLLVLVGAVLVTAAVLWWAFTTRRRWKRRLNAAAALVVAAAFLVSVAGLGFRYPAQMLGIVVAAVVYTVAARRALAGPAPSWSPPATPPRRPWLLVNARSGGGKAERLGLVAAAEQRGVAVHLLQPGDDPAALARSAVAAGADAVGVAGGDGTLGAVAAVAIDVGVPFVCVPTGTRNHFARDLGLDRVRPLAALAAFDGAQRQVDAGQVGERIFLNNVSLGAYAAIVAEPGYRSAKFATAHAVLPARLRGQQTALGLTLVDPEGRSHLDPLVLLIANNRYAARDPLTFGSRARLDEGVLEVSVLRISTGAELGGVVVRAVRGLPDATGAWAQWTAPTLRVDATPAGSGTTAPTAEVAATTVLVGIDGESVTLPVPLLFRVLPGALSVLVPAGSARAEASAVVGSAAVRRLGALAAGRPDER